MEQKAKKKDSQQSDARAQYGDIIDHPHYVDPDRTPMTRLNRAAQFSPFAALTGYEDLIGEAARQTGTRVEPDESAKEEIGRRLRVLLQLPAPITARITRFLPDERKQGGVYETVADEIRSYDENGKYLTTAAGTVIFLEDILEINADCFENELL